MATARSLIHRSNGRCGFRHSAADRTSSKIGPLGRLGPVAAHVNSGPLGQGRATELLPSAAEHLLAPGRSLLKHGMTVVTALRSAVRRTLVRVDGEKVGFGLRRQCAVCMDGGWTKSASCCEVNRGAQPNCQRVVRATAGIQGPWLVPSPRLNRPTSTRKPSLRLVE